MIRTNLKPALFALALGLAASAASAQPAVEPLPGLPPEIAKKIQADFDRHDLELKRLLDGIPGAERHRPFGPAFRFPIGKPPAFPALPGAPKFKEDFQAVTPRGVVTYRSSESAESFTNRNGQFELKLCHNGCQVKATGEVADGQPVVKEVVLGAGPKAKVHDGLKDLPDATRALIEAKLKEKLGDE